MPKTLAQLNKQIAQLQKQADAVRQKEVDDVISRIKEAVEHYGLTAADLGFGQATRRGRPPKSSAPVRKATRGAARKKPGKVKYRDDAGHTWSGHGRRPQWYIDAIASGKTPEQLAA